MLSNQPFYYKLLRKYVIVFGNMFNNITLIHKEKNTDIELRRIKVPIIYGPKDKLVTRLESDPDLFRAMQTILPRLSFEITGISYDASRKQNSLLRVARGESSARTNSQYMGVPYNINFELNLYAKNIDDGAQVAEQILPYFNPDYTVTINPVEEVGFLKDIPIILDNVTQNVRYEGAQDTVRYVNWTFTFTVKAYFFGPISSPKIIRKSIANIFNDASLTNGYISKLNLNLGNGGIFTPNDIAYQGDNIETASAYGIVYDWDHTLRKIVLTGVQGHFRANATLRASSSNAKYNIESFDTKPLKFVEIDVEPNPIDAQPGDDFGYTTTITEWPDTDTEL